jgi:2-polyprenyl-3-methyl-5-hydroxy-6-metoxy-1,4-benzoquinol methylase
LGRILSVGAGNGFTEVALRVAGFSVLATDRSDVALEYCRRKGLKTLRYEFPNQSLPTPEKFDVIYCDGLLGHLWHPEQGYGRCWVRFSEFCHAGALLILSNDLSDTDDMPALNVTGASDASFFRPPAGWFAQEAEASQLWTIEETRLLRYRRRGELRRREILALRYLLVDERKKKNDTSNIERCNFRFVE